jgi:2-polyprenyl-3-methyl-5-hydroxy-6-metoxy-1,4-benzoquinol methylase
MHICNLCGNNNLLPLINFGSHPISHHYLKDGQQDEYTHSVDLRFCEGCGLTQIVDPVAPEKFYTQLFALSSWKNQPHIQHEIELICNLPDISTDSRIVEIASNDGIFCRALLDAGYHRIIGIEPAQDAQIIARERGVETIGAYFNVDTAKEFVESYGQANLVIARQVLEHIPDLQEVQRALKIILAPKGYLLLEVPDFACNLKTFDYTLWEEHVNQFTIDTLKVFTDGIGLNIDHIETIVFSGQSIILMGSNTCKSVDQHKTYLSGLRKSNICYKETWPLLRKALIEFLHEHKKRGGKTAIYGAGGRACALVNYAGLGPYIDCFIDDQPEKQGLFMPGSRLPIFPNSHLYSDGIDLCLLAVCTENEDSVMAKHEKWIEDGGRFYSIYPPSDRLLPIWEKLINPG